MLTVNGKAEIVVQDAKSYQRLLDLAERLETIEAVKEGLASVDLGEGRPMDEVFDALEKSCGSRPAHDLPSHHPAKGGTRHLGDGPMD